MSQNVEEISVEISSINDKFQYLAKKFDLYLERIVLDDETVNLKCIQKENETLKKDFLCALKSNQTFRDELLEMKKFLENPVDISILSAKIDSLLQSQTEDSFSSKNYNINFAEIIEDKLKLEKFQNILENITEKNGFSLELIKIKDDFINVLMLHNSNLKLNKFNSQTSFSQELDQHKSEMSLLKNELAVFRAQNELKDKELEKRQNEINQLSSKVSEQENAFARFQIDHDNKVLEYKNELEECKSKIEIFEKSKDEIVEKYLEQFFPNISLINSMFERKISISDFYSEYLDFKKLNKDLIIEKNVLQERVENLIKELNDAKICQEKYLEEIKLLRRLEEKVLRIENEKKEQDISLRFYKESALSLYNGSKTFYESFQALSNKIKSLFKSETNQVISDENSSSTLALKYIMELQNKFQEYSSLQNEFERKKLDFLNEKQNLIDNENTIESLKNKILILESEKQHLNNKFNLLDDEYEIFKKISKRAQDESNSKTEDSKKIIERLNKSLTDQQKDIDDAKCTIKKFSDQELKFQEESIDLQNKLSHHQKQIESLQSRSSMQTQTIEFLEKCLETSRKQNKSTTKINFQLDNRTKTMENRLCEMQAKVFKFDSLLNASKLKIDFLQQKERLLLDKLKINHEDSVKNEKLDSLIQSLQQQKCSLDSTVINKFEDSQKEREHMSKTLELKEKQWNEQRQIFEKQINHLETMLKDEQDKYVKLIDDYRNDQQIRSSLNNTDTLNQVILESDSYKKETESVKSQNETLFKRIFEINTESNVLKSKIIELNKELEHKTKANNELEYQIIALCDENSKQVSEAQRSKFELEASLGDLQRKFKESQDATKNFEHLLLSRQRMCENHLKTIDLLKIQILNYEMELKKNGGPFDQQSSDSLKQSYSILENDFQICKKQLDEERKLVEELRKKIYEMQNRYAESEVQKFQTVDNFKFKLENFEKKNIQLKKQQDEISRFNQELFTQLARLNELVKNSNTSESVEEQKNKVSTFNEIVDTLTLENKFLLSEFKAKELTENRLNKEIETLKINLDDLEKCFQRERKNLKNIHDYIQQNDSKSNLNGELLKVHQSLQEKISEISKKNSILQQENDVLNDFKKNAQNQKDLEKVVSENNIQITALKIQLEKCEANTNSLIQQLELAENRKSDFEKKYNEVLLRCRQQNTMIERTKTDYSVIQNTSEKNLNDFKQLKESSSKEIEELKNQLETLRKESSSLQRTNQQLKILAKKYKSQWEELQQKTDQENKQTIHDSDLSSQKLKELEQQSKDFSAQNKILTDEIENLTRQNQILITENDKQKIDLEKLSTKLRNIENLFKAKIRAKQAAQVIRIEPDETHQRFTEAHPKSGGKMATVSSTNVSASIQQPISSSFVDASSSIFQAQPSCSSSSFILFNEDNDRLQSAHITSHTTEDQVFDNRMFPSTSKRRFIKDSSSDRQLVVKRLKNDQPLQNVYEEVSETPLIGSNNNEDLNDDDDDLETEVEEKSENIIQHHQPLIEQGSSLVQEESIVVGGSTDQTETTTTTSTSANDDNASSSQNLPLPPSSSSSSVPQINIIDFSISGPSSSSTSHQSSAITSQANVISATGSSRYLFQESSSVHPLAVTSRMVGLQASTVHQDDLLSPQNVSLMNPNFGPSSVGGSSGSYEETDGVVPSTPIMFGNSRFEYASISPQVPQARFLFQQNQNIGAAVGSSNNNYNTFSTTTTPTISETVSSLVSVEDIEPTVSETFFDQMESSGQEDSSSAPSSSDNTTTNSSTQAGPSTGRSRKLKIHGLSTKRPG